MALYALRLVLLPRMPCDTSTVDVRSAAEVTCKEVCGVDGSRTCAIHSIKAVGEPHILQTHQHGTCHNPPHAPTLNHKPKLEAVAALTRSTAGPLLQTFADEAHDWMVG